MVVVVVVVGGQVQGASPMRKENKISLGILGYNKQNNNFHEYIVRMWVEHEGE